MRNNRRSPSSRNQTTVRLRDKVFLGGLFALLLLSSLPAKAADTVIFTFTNSWRYSNTGADLGTGWRATTFNDSAWPQGPGLLGLESGTIAGGNTIRTPLTRSAPGTTGPNIITDYFRTHFNLTGSPAGVTLRIRHQVDDGFILYLNGNEVLRVGLAAGAAVSSTTLFASNEGKDAIAGPVNILATGLVTGDNVLAAEVHQTSADSSDILFGIELIASTPAPVGIAIPATLSAGAPLKTPGGDLKGEYWKRPVNTIRTDGATVAANRIDTQIKGFGTASATFKATKFVYTGNDLTPLTNWLSTDVSSLAGTASNLDDGAFRFTGFINVPAAGAVNLGTESDDGSRITIGGIDIINNDSGHGDQTRDTNVVFAAAGVYPIEITYFNGDWTSDGTGANLNHSGSTDPSVHGGANFRLRVSGANVTPALAGMFYSSAVPPVTAVTLMEFNFNEGTGTTVKSTDGKLTGTFGGTNGVPSFSTDTPTGKAGDFSLQFSAGKQVIVPDPNTVLQLDTAKPDFTIEAWVKFATPAARSVFFYNQCGGGRVSASVFSDRTAFVTTLGILDVQSKAAIPNDGGWHHMAVVHETGKELRFYVDGALGDTVAYTRSVSFNATNKVFYIGSEPTGGLQYTGFLDRLRYTKGMLTPAQLDSKSGAPPPTAIGGALFVYSNISGTMNPSDRAVTNRLGKLGFKVTPVLATAGTTASANGQSIVVISSTPSSGDIGTKWRDVTIPVLDWEQAVQDDLRFTLDTANDHATITGQLTLAVTNLTHPAAAGLVGTTRNTKAGSEYGWGVPNTTASIIARSTDGGNRAVVYTYDTGALLIDKATAAAGRRVHWGAGGGNDTAINFTEEAWSLFDNLVLWAVAEGTAPKITEQPADVSTTAGRGITLTAVATGALPLRFQWQKNGTDIAGATNRVLYTGPLAATDNNAAYTVKVTNSEGTVTSAAAKATVAAGTIAQGFLLREVYSGFGGVALADITNKLQYPNAPDSRNYITKFETPTDVADNYAVRLSGYLLAPETGDYILYLCADDNAALFLSTDENPANKKQIAFEPQWNPARQWVATTRRTAATPENRATVRLESGKRYFVEALMKEAGGGDNLGVAWKLPSQTTPPADGSDSAITSPFLAVLADPAKASITITKQPVGGSSEAADKAVLLTVTATATSDISATEAVAIQWQKDGANVAGATGSTLALGAVSDTGKYKAVLSVPGKSVTTDEVTVTITPDVTAPRITSAEPQLGAAGEPQVKLVFSEPVSAATATNVANYALSGGTVRSAKLVPGNAVALTVNALAPGASYTVTVNAVKDTAGNSVAANTAAAVPPFTVSPGFLRREMYKGLSTSDNTVAGLTNSAKFPNSPDLVQYLTQAEGPVNVPAADGGEGYGTRLSGFVIPPETGNYVFYIAADDNANLFLSTDDNPANKKLIAIETVWSNNRQWITSGGASALPSKRSDTYAGSQWPTKGVITLTAGKLYYVEALQKEGSGGDNIGFTWRLPSQTTDPVANSPSIQGAFLAAFATIPGADVTITTQPKPVTVGEGGTATFTVAATGITSANKNETVFVQWQRNGVNLTGRTGTTLTLSPVKTSDAGSIRAVVSVPGKSVNSDAVTLTVNPDIVPPTIVSANAWARPNNVTVTFSEGITDSSGNSVGNFSINNGILVQSAKKTAANVVELTTTTLARGTPYVLIVNGVQDLASVPNTIAKFSTILINTAPALPADFGQTVNGFQDDFGGDRLDPGWVPVSGPNGRTDVYTLGDGMLHVGRGFNTGIPGDPNHLLYEGATYHTSNQEVLARIRVVSFGSGDPARAGIAVATSGTTSQGINYHFRNEGGQGVHTEFLDDNRAWGTELPFKWTTNTWYWMRLKHQPNTATGQADMFAKVWKADGTELEPTDFMSTWDRYPAATVRTGFAGVTATSIGSTANDRAIFDVDYILIKADGLPSIQVQGSQVPPVIAPTTSGPVGGPLESGSTVVNDPLTGSYTVTGGGSDIWSASDQFQYAYQDIAGDFDVQVRLESLEPRNKWSKAGIMVREQLVANSRHAFERATPLGPTIDKADTGTGANDVRFAYKTGLSAGVLGEHEDGTGSPTYPNTWLRLRRTGTMIVAYRGTNGVDWVQQGQQDTGEWEGGSFNDRVFLGLAVTSHNNGAGQTAKAEFRQYGPTPATAIKAPPVITKQPANATAVENQVANFSVTVDDPFFFQWFKNGAPIPGATRPNLHLTTAFADNNATISVVASNAIASVTSANAVLTVRADTNAPAVVSAITFGDPTHITVTFSKAVSSASATKAANYTLNNGVAIKAAARPNPTTVVLETATTLSPGVAPVALTVKDVQDLSATPNNITPNPASLNVLFSQGFIMQKYFQFSATPSLANLTNDARFPNNPDFITIEPASEYPPNGANEAGSNYGNQLVGYVFAPVTGNYVFFLCADDNALLYLSTDANPANKKLIAQETAWSNARQWVSSGGSSTLTSKRSDRFTGSTWPTKNVITLTAGSAYYIEAVHQEGGGGDNVGVTWQLPGAAAPTDGAPPIPGRFLSTPLPSGPITITKQPQNATVGELGAVSFSVEVTGTPPFSFQWSSNGIAIPSASVTVSGTTSTLTLAPSRTANNAKISVEAKNNFSSATSSVALINVIPDTTAPALLSATRGPVDLDRVAVVFSETVTTATANVAANYSINNGATVTSASLGGDGRTVTLRTGAALPNGVLFTLTVNGVKDPLGNTIAANSRVLVTLLTELAPFQQDAGSQKLVVFEAENFERNTPATAAGVQHSWVPSTEFPGFSGASAMESAPNSGAGINEPNFVTESPRLDYSVNFVTSGIHYLWVRGWGRTGSDDSIHAGINGAGLSNTAWRVTGWGTSWSWQRNSSATPARIFVPTAGKHVINIWMREDGTLIDKILLTTDPNFTPTGLGPAESLRSSGPIVTVTDTVETFQNVAVSISATKLVANDIAGAPGGLIISDVSAKSAQGGTISFRGDSITYTPPAGFTGADSFTYTALNSADASANGLVIVNVNLATQQSQNVVTVSKFGLGVTVVQFVGIPGRTYTIQASTDLVTWKALGPATANSRGVITFVDSDAGETQKFYRTVFP